HAKTLRLKKTPAHRHTKTGVIHIGIATHDDNVAAIPAQRSHLGAGHGRKRRRLVGSPGRASIREEIFGEAIHKNPEINHRTAVAAPKNCPLLSQNSPPVNSTKNNQLPLRSPTRRSD